MTGHLWVNQLKPGDQIVDIRRGAVLVQRKVGRFKSRSECICPFACLAACEPCEFTPEPDYSEIGGAGWGMP
jgi:hypothetical protein